VFPAVFAPQKTSAQVPFVPTLDSLNLVQNTVTAVSTAALVKKEAILDGFGWIVTKLIISNITNSIVSWINSGFQGGPAFVTNPQEFFVGVADQAAGAFIAGTELGFACQPFQLDIRAALNYQYSSDFTIACTLSGVLQNAENFADFTGGNFSRGGWDGWFSLTQNQNNNPYGAYTKAKAELELRISTAQGTESLKLDWGKGFLSFEDENGNIQTPGSVIESQLENVLGSGVRQLELADEFNEIVSALVGQLVQTVLIDGLAAVSGSDSDGGQNQNISGYCFSDIEKVTVGKPVTWTASVIGNSSRNPVFVWGGSDPISFATSTADSVTVAYPTSGTKNAHVRATIGGQSKTFNCYNTVNVQGITI